MIGYPAATMLMLGVEAVLLLVTLPWYREPFYRLGVLIVTMATVGVLTSFIGYVAASPWLFGFGLAHIICVLIIMFRTIYVHVDGFIPTS